MSKYGFAKVARDIKSAIPEINKSTAQRIELPEGKFENEILEYAKHKLNEKTLYHCLRVYIYGVAIMNDQFPAWDMDKSVLFTASLLHDIGTTDENMGNTKMSFEFYGGMVAHDLVLNKTKDRDYADAVSEAIFRHQDLGETGYITNLGLIIQIATILDNVGKNSELIHKDTLEYANQLYPRDGWISCFASVIDKENSEKPWGHTSALGVPDFREAVLGNNLTYEKPRK